ncbi:VOC family protein [Thalassobacillus sp. CUG 92003]|uniref:VOC family protein n=1 Tax=Thalassobacillus sp. CUG 92003 TaxID=2736641 RepID=UPI0015E79440|nr:VOC family protein [Thalassobacillus sp. CUG 92003]
MALHHIEIYVSNLSASAQFWNWLLQELGYQIYQQWPEGISWIHEGTYIVFVQAEKEYVAAGYHRKRIGLNHLAFNASSKAHVDKITERLVEMNVPILYQDAHPYAGGDDYYALYFEDPDRIKVEVVANV